MSNEVTPPVARWTGAVSAHANGGFVAYSDYLALQREHDRYKHMFNDAVGCLSAIDEALGIPPEESGGAVPILAGIERLKFAARVPAPSWERGEAVSDASFAPVEALQEAVAEALGNAYDCLRTWSAWGVGTMGQDDFALVREDADRVAEIANVIHNFPTFQARVLPWLLECFGAEIAADPQERSHRFLEEALELVQACGATESEAHQLVQYVYARPVGDKAQEVGGVMVTLAALCLAQGLDMHAAGEAELARIWTKVEQIRAKQAAKPKHSPLPEFQAGPVLAGYITNWPNGNRSMRFRDEMTQEKFDYAAQYGGKITPVHVLPWRQEEPQA